jgi:hypothetical protein
MTAKRKPVAKKRTVRRKKSVAKPSAPLSTIVVYDRFGQRSVA